MCFISYTLIGELLQNRAVMKEMEGNILWNLHVNDNFTFYTFYLVNFSDCLTSFLTSSSRYAVVTTYRNGKRCNLEREVYHA